MKNLENSLSGARLLAGAAAAITIFAFSAGTASAAANCIKGDRKAPYTVGWANIYSVPTWMKQTEGTIAAEVGRMASWASCASLLLEL